MIELRWIFKKLRFLYNRSFSDEAMVCRQHRKLLGRTLDLNDPKGFHEKICWLRLNRFTPLQTYCADKITAAAYVYSRVGPGFTAPRHFVTTDPGTLSAKSIPGSACVIKPNHASQSVAVVEDVASADWNSIRLRMATSLRRNHYWWARERQYRDIPPALIVEDLIDMRGVNPGEVNLYCLDGRVAFCLAFEPGAILAGNRGALVDRNFELLPVTRQRYPTTDTAPPRPPDLERMIETAEALASPFPMVRVDFLRSKSSFYVNELTFSPIAGYDRFIPESFEQEMGARITHDAPLPDWQSLLEAARACERHVLPPWR